MAGWHIPGEDCFFGWKEGASHDQAGKEKEKEKDDDKPKQAEPQKAPR